MATEAQCISLRFGIDHRLLVHGRGECGFCLLAYTAPAWCCFRFVVAMAGWLLGSTSLVVATVATVLFVVGITYAEWAGLFKPTGRADVVAVAGTYLAVLPVISFLTYGARKSLMTSRKQALDLSHDMAQQNAVLRERETEIQSLLENMPAAVASFDVHSNLRQCNRRYAALYGVAPADILGKHVSAYAPEVAQDQMREAGRGALRGQAQSYRRFNVHPQTHAVTWLDVGVTPQFDNGIVVGLHTVLVDVTDKVQAEAEILSLNTELEQRVERRTRELARAQESLQSSHDELVRSQAKAGLAAMVASVSHELGNPGGQQCVDLVDVY